MLLLLCVCRQQAPGRHEAGRVVHVGVSGGGAVPLPVRHPVREGHPGGLQLPQLRADDQAAARHQQGAPGLRTALLHWEVRAR